MKLHSKRRQAMTLVEMMFVTAISIMVAVPVLSTMTFVMRTHATAEDQSLQRIRTDKVTDQISMDIRNTSRGTYNSVGWAVLSGTATTDPTMVLSLFDTVLGQRIKWTYTRSTRKLSRETTQYDGATAVVTISTKDYNVKFQDFTMAEVIQPDPAPATTSQITAIRVVGRTFLTMTPYNTTWQEVDGNGDNDLRDDKIGAALFGRTDQNDDPKWQYVFNVETAFRNT
ncbi:hypothetical protein BH09SUM1_BH09SUM1_11080 [soil metagenome]